MKKNISRRWIISWIAVAAAMLVGLVSYAAYTNLNSVKRVVSTQGGRGTAFSSNYLNLVTMKTTTYAMKNISFSESAESVSFEINVCNYVHNDPSMINENDITYSLVLELVDTSGAAVTGSYEGLMVTDSDNVSRGFSNGVCNVPARTLMGGVKSVDTYKITVPKDLINTVNIKAAAEPDSASYAYTDNNKLGRIFTFSEYNAAATTWTGSFTETTSEGYDGFNYVIKGQGKGTVTLTWDSENIEINNIFLVLNGLTPTFSNGKAVITIDVDSDITNRYDIQFYKTENGDYSDMSVVNSYVELEFADTAAAG